MLRLRFANRVPDHAVNVAFVEVPDLAVRSNVSLLDMSYKRTQNLSSYVGGELDISLSGASNRVDTDESVISPRSVLSKGLKRPIPLYYKYYLGTRFGLSVKVDASTLTDARLELLKQIQILDRRNNKVNGPEWDVEVTGQDAHGNFHVTMYLAHRQGPGETFKAKYQAADTITGADYPNHIEVINSTPILVDGVDYTLSIETDGYSISGLSAANMADGIGLFYKGVNPSASVTLSGGPPATQISLTRDTLPPVVVSLAGLSIQGLVAAINEAGAEWEAIPLNDNPVCSLEATVVLVTSYGHAFKQYNYARVKYTEETRVAPLLPYRDLQFLPWYPRVDKGQFSQAGTLNGLSCKFLFAPQGNAVILPPGRNGGTLYDRLDEKPIILDPKILKLRRPNLSPSSLRITYGTRELTGIIEDYDELNSVLFLNREFGDPSNLFVSYSYYEDSIIYTAVDLNPLGQHSPELLGKYVGLYMTPSRVFGALPSGSVDFDRTLWHVVADEIGTIESLVDSVKFDTGEDAEALLLGIYRVGQAATIDEANVTDTRSRGGGMKDISEPSKAVGAEETAMFWDFSMWDGVPFPPTAVIVDYPSEVLGTGEPSLEADPTLRFADPSGFHRPVGLLSSQQVQAKIDRYKAGGIVAIINPEDSLNG